MIPSLVSQDDDFWNVIKERIKSDLAQKRLDLNEINLKLDQSQDEIQKLTERNTLITAQLHQIQGQIEKLSQIEIRKLYDSALEAQQRLSVIRIQTEKLKSDKHHLAEYISAMESISNALVGGDTSHMSSKGSGSTTQIVEMLIQAQESERQRLSRQMHDGPAQALSNFILQTEIAMRLFDMEEAKARAELENLKQAATITFQKVRDFIFELRPMMLDDLGLAPTLKRYVEIIKDESKIEPRLLITGRERRLESYQEVMLFRGIQELIYNSTRHSKAKSIKIQLDMGESTLKVTVDDDGQGFDPQRLEQGRGIGLKVIRDRVEMMGGNLEIDSSTGQGTRVKIETPAVDRKASS